MNQDLFRLWRHIDQPKRKQLIFLFGLMITCSIAEVVSIGAVIPFLSILIEPEKFFLFPKAQPFLRILSIEQPNQLIGPFSIIFATAAIIAGGIRLLLLKISTKLGFSIGADLSVNIYWRTLFQPYSVHITRNSSEVIAGVITKTTAVIYGIIIPSLTLLSSVIILIVISTALLFIDPQISIITLCLFGSIYALIIKNTHKRVNAAGHCIAEQSTRVVKAMQEGLGGIRDILIDGSQVVYCEIYKESDKALRNAQETNQFISQYPRYVIETLGMVTIAAVAFWMTQDPTTKTDAIPLLGAFALGAQRLLPVLQNAFSSITSIQGAIMSLSDVLALLDQKTPASAGVISKNPIDFSKTISLQNISFRYTTNPSTTLSTLTLQIQKGSRIGILGTTGSGKSTFLDILMGLLPPTTGNLAIDGVPIDENNLRDWQARIAHVPQTIFLSDSSITENIAFGFPPSLIDHDRVRYAAKKAQISETIESWPDQYETKIGERGVRISGGQRQRIGIARALYKKADVIIFDEATSALDNKTEEAVMSSLENLDKELTIFIVAHRLSTLKHCTNIIQLEGGRICRTGTYNDIVKI